MTVPSAIPVAASPSEYGNKVLRGAFGILDAWRDRLACEICRRGPE